MKLASSLRHYDKSNLRGDITAGLVVAAVTIPIAMGYAQIAGLPAVYGLYGSVLPILLFSIFATSPQMIFGVDAAPAALVGGMLATAGVAAESSEALRLVPVITFLTALWLLLFALLKAGRLIRYISESVMGGFISGIGVTIIFMQIPKLMGCAPGRGEFLELAKAFATACTQVNGPSLALGLSTLAVILLGKRFCPKVPMAVIVMAAGAAAQYFFHLDALGVALLPAVSPGLPALSPPDFSVLQNVSADLGMTLTIAIVITAETLLSSNNAASRAGVHLDGDQDILAYGIGNLAAAALGCCPVNGSVSRMGLADQYGRKTQLTGIVAGLTMAVLLLCGTGFIGYLPVPVLTAIVISALMGVVEVKQAVRLFKVDRWEFWIFISALLGVLILGTIYGVLAGVVLSFVSVLRQAMAPPTELLGVIPGHKRFYSLSRNQNARPIEHVVIYRFSSNLFFANIGIFEEEVEKHIQADTRVFIVDASGITSIDMTAADHLANLYRRMKAQGIAFYLTEHIASLNDRLRDLGYADLLQEGLCRRLISIALADAGYVRPYPLIGEVPEGQRSLRGRFKRQVISEFEWLFGDQAEAEMEKFVTDIITESHPGESLEDAIAAGLVHSDHAFRLSSINEDELLEHLEMHLGELAGRLDQNEYALGAAILRRRRAIARHLAVQDPALLAQLKLHRKKVDALMKSESARAFQKMLDRRRALDGHHAAEQEAAETADDAPSGS